MTYTPDSNFSNDFSESTEPSISTFEKLKTLTTEGRERSQRVATILRRAFSETAAEFKEGRETLSPLAKEVTAETVATVKDKSQQAVDVLNHTWQQESDKKDLSDRIVAVMSRLASTLKVTLLPQLKGQAKRLDGALSDRYGQRYSSLKDQFETVRDRYTTSDSTHTQPFQAEDASDSSVVIEVDSEVIR